MTTDNSFIQNYNTLPSKNIPIYILGEKHFWINISDEETVTSLKFKISKYLNISFLDIRLVYNQQLLEDKIVMGTLNIDTTLIGSNKENKIYLVKKINTNQGGTILY